MDLRRDMGQVFDSLQYLPITGFGALLGFFKEITVNDWTRFNQRRNICWPRLCSNSIKIRLPNAKTGLTVGRHHLA